MQRRHAGDEVALLVSRRGRLRRIVATLGAPERATWTLELDADASPAQRHTYEEWLGAE